MTSREIMVAYARGFYGNTGSQYHDIKKVLKDKYLTANWFSIESVIEVVLDIFEDDLKSKHYRRLLGYRDFDLLSQLLRIIAYNIDFDGLSDEVKNAFRL